jgi:hypothetical protein
MLGSPVCIVGDQPTHRKQVRTLTQPTEQPHPFLEDAWTTWMLINFARKRAIVRAFGVSPEDANTITVIGLVLMAGAIHQTCGRAIRRSVPTRADSLLAAGTARAVLSGIAGPVTDEMPGVGLIAFALVAHAARPTVTRSVHAVRAEWHRFALGFHQRYGPPASPAVR